MAVGSNSSKRIRDQDLFVSSELRPGWVSASERTPAVGEAVFCVGGEGTVVAVLGKTGDGSRLLEIRLADPTARPFFAAASNVLVAPKAA
jgi:hypothetical protein